MSDEQSTERELEREGRRLQRLRLVAALPQESDRDEQLDDFDPEPQEAA